MSDENIKGVDDLQLIDRELALPSNHRSSIAIELTFAQNLLARWSRQDVLCGVR